MKDKKAYKGATIKDKDGNILAEPETTIVAYVGPQKKKSPHPYGVFATMNSNALIELSTSDLSALEIRLLLRLIGEMPIGNEGVVNQSDVAEIMGVSRQHINRALKKLTDAGYISKEMRGRSQIIKISPIYAWKGTSKNLISELKAATDKTARERRDKFTVYKGGKAEPKFDPETGEIFD